MIQPPKFQTTHGTQGSNRKDCQFCGKEGLCLCGWRGKRLDEQRHCTKCHGILVEQGRIKETQMK